LIIRETSLGERMKDVEKGAAIRLLSHTLTRQLRGELAMRISVWRILLRVDQDVRRSSEESSAVAQITSKLEVEIKARRAAQRKNNEWLAQAKMNEERIAKLTNRLEVAMGYMETRTPTNPNGTANVEKFTSLSLLRGKRKEQSMQLAATEAPSTPLAITHPNSNSSLGNIEPITPDLALEGGTGPARYHPFQAGHRARSEKFTYSGRC